jgi:hypothetical protein
VGPAAWHAQSDTAARRQGGSKSSGGCIRGWSSRMARTGLQLQAGAARAAARVKAAALKQAEAPGGCAMGRSSCMVRTEL